MEVLKLPSGGKQRDVDLQQEWRSRGKDEELADRVKSPAAGAASIKQPLWAIKTVADLKNGGSNLFHSSEIS